MTNIINSVLATIKRERFVSISNILTLTVTNLLLASFIFIIAFSQTALRYLEQQVQISIFLKDDFPEEKILQLKSDLEKDVRVQSVKYVSKEDAFKIFTELNKDEPILLESISPSILPASLELKAFNLADLDPMSQELLKNDGVEEIRFFKDVVQRFKSLSSIVYIVGFALIFVFFVISVSIITLTLRATIHAKGTELEIMKLVGATDKYIKMPLIYQGVFFGIIASLIASFFTLIAGLIIDKSGAVPAGFTFGFMPSLYIRPFAFALLLSIILMFFSVTLGWLGSHFAVKKYLKY